MEASKIKILSLKPDGGIKTPFLNLSFYLTEMLGQSIDKKVIMTWKNPEPEGNLFYVKNTSQFFDKETVLDINYLEGGQRVYVGNNPPALKVIRLTTNVFTLNELIYLITENLNEDEETKISSEKIAFCFNAKEKIVVLFEI
ncbi:MAG: hypothetical protein NT068_01560 [Candidatus Nomurabacteria bacterium]|nr:hypothetical protein [Candidatus Nomurabacteria bacterium]